MLAMVKVLLLVGFDIDTSGNTYNLIEGGNVYPSFYNQWSSKVINKQPLCFQIIMY